MAKKTRNRKKRKAGPLLKYAIRENQGEMVLLALPVTDRELLLEPLEKIKILSKSVPYGDKMREALARRQSKKINRN